MNLKATHKKVLGLLTVAFFLIPNICFCSTKLLFSDVFQKISQQETASMGGHCHSKNDDSSKDAESEGCCENGMDFGKEITLDSDLVFKTKSQKYSQAVNTENEGSPIASQDSKRLKVFKEYDPFRYKYKQIYIRHQTFLI